jgi:deoxycytidylate deaminase
MSRTVNFRNMIDFELSELKEFAAKNQSCLRKAVGCSLATIIEKTGLNFLRAHNGPAHRNHRCTNEVGNCGCCHAEPRAVIKALKNRYFKEDCILVCTYSPCTNCANIILASEIITGVVYDILTEHDKRGAELLEAVMPVFTRTQLQEGKADVEIKKWIQRHNDS